MEQNTTAIDTPPAADSPILLPDLDEPRSALHRARLRYGRPGPKSWLQEHTGHPPAPLGRIAELPAALAELHVLVSLPADRPGPPRSRRDHPFVTLVWTPEGEPITDEGGPEVWRAKVAAAADRSKRRVGRTVLYRAGARVLISTVFLAQDMGFGFDDGPPVLWETMIFFGLRQPGQDAPTGPRWRYRSRPAAVHGHGLIVAAIRRGWGRS